MHGHDSRALALDLARHLDRHLVRRSCTLATVAACGVSVSDDPDLGSAAPAPAPARAAAEDGVNPRLLRRFKPLHALAAIASATEQAQIDLGRMMFFDKRLSRDRDLSCNSCHHLDKYGVDNQPTSIGTNGQRGTRNSPSVYHAAGNFSSFWDGRAPDVEAQAVLPIVNPKEMAMADERAVTSTLAAIPGYVAAFRAAFPDDADPVTYANIGRAIGAFERRLQTPARWDRFLAGDHAALTADEIAGLKLFTDAGCITCHTGELVGGSMFQKAGALKPWPNQADQGRYEITKLDADRMQFKVPSLRNVARTAPYFHDASATTLADAVRMMADRQLDSPLSDPEVDLIVKWLGSLTGELPADYIAEPPLPQ